MAVQPLAGGKTRIYAGIGNGSNTAANLAHVFRTDDAVAATGDVSWTDLTALQDASAAPNQTTGYCSSNAAVPARSSTPPQTYLITSGSP